MSSVSELKRQKRDIINRYGKADDLKGLTQVVTTLAPLGFLWAAAVRGAEVSLWLTAGATLLMSLFTMRVLVLMHECGHGSLFSTDRLNRIFGFIFGVVSGMPQYVWAQHHDFHHTHNGNWEKYRGPLNTPSVEEYAAMSSAQRFRYRHTRSIAVAPVAGFIYLLFNPRFTWLKGSFGLLTHIIYKKVMWSNSSQAAQVVAFRTRCWNSPAEYWHMFWNNVVLLSAWVSMCWAVGCVPFFTIYSISVSLAGGAAIVLFTVQHNFEHAYASDSERWDYDTSALEGTSFLVLPRWLNWITADIAYHHIHHLSAKIPNYRLVKCHNEYKHLFASVTRVNLHHIPRALKCILWDSNAQRIISIAEYRQQHRPA